MVVWTVEQGEDAKHGSILSTDLINEASCKSLVPPRPVNNVNYMSSFSAGNKSHGDLVVAEQSSHSRLNYSDHFTSLQNYS